jgi:hypothetical protein
VGRNSEMRAFAEGLDRNAGAGEISQDMGRKQGRRKGLTSRHGHSSVDSIVYRSICAFMSVGFTSKIPVLTHTCSRLLY